MVMKIYFGLRFFFKHFNLKALNQIYLEVIKTVTHKGKDNVVIQKFLTNHPDQNIPFFDIKMNHWNVETYHHLKDTKLNEDKYRKSKENAKIYAIINNIIAFTYEDKKLEQSDIENLKIDLMFWILIKIYRTVLILNFIFSIRKANKLAFLLIIYKFFFVNFILSTFI